jgi:dTDP-4-dehydrorhamnose 3,5-epimerase
MIKEIKQSKLQGCLEIYLNQAIDKRGSFIKTFHQEIFKEHNIQMHVAEEYFSNSTKNVFRGMHFQLPPMDHEKMVMCIKGSVTDYVVDLRKTSETYGEFTSFQLSEDTPQIIYIPKGMAHGFYVHSEDAILHYKVSTVYNEIYDAGIKFTSFPFAAEINNPIISDRDLNFPDFNVFKTPF